jgi:uroporphyrin-III C-methyltransferase/precorrin-2 dehydrogenase/sirohydrochlorin ferrochelatase
MDYLPIYLDVRGRPCLVVGDGAEAKAKIEWLKNSGAEVRQRAEVGESDFEDVVLVVAASDDSALDEKVAALAAQRRLPCQVVSAPECGNFVSPVVIDRSPLLISLSTAGAAPSLTRLVRDQVEALFPPFYAKLGQAIGSLAEAAKARFPGREARARFWERMLTGASAWQLQPERLNRSAAQALQDQVPPAGQVYVIGAGPGDPGLLTLNALRLMQQADVVLYDRLVGDEIMALIPERARTIYVGKERGYHSCPQEEINALLVRLAREGKRVIRLKGGDPFIFGRGAEEIAELVEAGVSFQVVPGVTAGAGCAAYSGIPLTHRDHAQSCTFVTGHTKDGRADLDWPALVRPHQTLVIYMGIQGLPHIAQGLIAHGMNPEMPAAIVERGTSLTQRVHVGTIKTLPEISERAQVKAPALVIVGEVVRLRERLAWFERIVPPQEANNKLERMEQ